MFLSMYIVHAETSKSDDTTAESSQFMSISTSNDRTVIYLADVFIRLEI